VIATENGDDPAVKAFPNEVSAPVVSIVYPETLFDWEFAT
jgi:hypothetical protein